MLSRTLAAVTCVAFVASPLPTLAQVPSAPAGTMVVEQKPGFFKRMFGRYIRRSGWVTVGAGVLGVVAGVGLAVSGGLALGASVAVASAVLGGLGWTQVVYAKSLLTPKRVVVPVTTSGVAPPRGAQTTPPQQHAGQTTNAVGASR